jgi:hypothetical protein
VDPVPDPLLIRIKIRKHDFLDSKQDINNSAGVLCHLSYYIISAIHIVYHDFIATVGCYLVDMIVILNTWRRMLSVAVGKYEQLRMTSVL